MRKSKRIILIITLLIIAAVIIVFIKLITKTRKAYSVVSETTLKDGNIKGYYSIDDVVLCYTTNEIYLTNVSGKKTWSTECDVSNPKLFKCLNTYAIADINGNKVITFDKDGKLGSYNVGGVILNAAVADNAITALLIKINGQTEIHLYDKNGELLVKSTIGGSIKKYPVSIALSPDGTKLLVSYLKTDSTFKSTFTVYDFSKYKKNATDSCVYEKSFNDTIISDIVFLDEQNYVVIGDSKIFFYQGFKKPQILKKITYQKEIKSVFAINNKLGVILNEENGQVKSTLHIYNYKGKEKTSADIDISYTHMSVSNGAISLYNDYNGVIYTTGGSKIFEGAFDDSVLYVQSTSGLHKFILITNDKIQEVRLT